MRLIALLPTPPAWHAVPVDKLLEILAARSREGLKPDQVLERQSQYGLNRLAETPPVPLWKKFLAQFADVLIWILISAALIAGALGERLDAAAILAIVLMNGVLGFLQEEKAQRELSALRKRSAYSATAIRDGKQHVVAAEELVPGDLIELEAGDHIPADARRRSGNPCRLIKMPP